MIGEFLERVREVFCKTCEYLGRSDSVVLLLWFDKRACLKFRLGFGKVREKEGEQWLRAKSRTL